MTTLSQKTIGIDASRANSGGRTGVEWYAFHVIQELKHIIPESYHVILYSREPLTGGLEVLPAHWESRVLRWFPRRLWTQLRLSWEMLRRPPQMLFVPAHVLPLVLPKRAITTVHDVAFMAMPDAYGFFGGIYLRYATWQATRRAILTVSEFSKREIVKYFHADPARITVTPLGFDATGYGQIDHDEARRRVASYGIFGPFFLFVGRLERKKNLSGLLAAFRIFKESRPGEVIKLVLVGKRGRGYEDAMRFVADTAVRADVIEPGYVKQEDLPAFYAAATVFIFPSWYEGFGIPVLEAFASKTPVIASRATAIPEVAGDAACYADPAVPRTFTEAMVHVVDDPSLRERLIAQGTAQAAKFSWRMTAEKTWGEMEKVLEMDAATELTKIFKM